MTKFFEKGPMRAIVLALWVVLALLLGKLFPQINSIDNVALVNLPADQMSTQAAELKAEHFASNAGIPLLITWQRDTGLTEEDIKGVQTLYKELEVNPLTTQQFIPPLGTIPAQALMGSVSEDGKALVTPIFFKEDASTAALKDSLADITTLTKKITGVNPYSAKLSEDVLHARYSGPVGISVDATDLFKSADFQLMAATVLIILVILLVIYRSPLLAIIPLVVVSIAFLVVSPLLGAMTEAGWLVKDAQAVSIMIVLLFGAGTDYCLFLITRYRDTLLVEPNKLKALTQSLRAAGGAIIMSAATVVIGLLTLLLANYGAFHRFAIPFSFGILITAIAVLTLLPAILGLLGRYAFWPFIPRTEEMARAHANKKGKPYVAPKPPHRIMRKIGRFTVKRHWLVITITALILVGLAAVSPKIDFSYDLLSSFPEEMPSREGFAIIEEHFTAGELAPVSVIVKTDEDITDALAALPYVGKVAKPQQADGYQLYSVDLKENPYAVQAMTDLAQMKQDVGELVGADAFWLGGETSEQVDTKTVQEADEKLIQPTMIVIIFVLLVLYLRAPLTAVSLMATVVVSFFAALGAGWLIIHYVLGQPAMASAIPLYSFVFIVALGNDYNIFMISEVWKNRQKGVAHHQAIENGVASTGAVITSAGIILAGTFMVLASLPIQLLVQFGIVTALGIVLDTFIVRPLLVPALLAALGKVVYWPSKLWRDGK
ncbi:Putative membrane protein YdgH [Metalysinibacillus saudimassiliensis]|uniref:Putative membrane protein YdgH n=1 Tax=Metalysinibacillus saudimassiliensis TaxID=1461583 RepID=A0A078MEG3_9BACL|nr:Putative membrane protein YdgH [Metalysinibacillus saudimassiliensis]